MATAHLGDVALLSRLCQELQPQQCRQETSLRPRKAFSKNMSAFLFAVISSNKELMSQ